MKELDSFLLIKNGVVISNWLIIMDNAFIYRSTRVETFIEDRKLNVLYIPTYFPELALVKKYFSMLKRLVAKGSSGLQLNWKSIDSRDLLKNSIHLITSKNVQGFWLTLTYEMKDSLTKLHTPFIYADWNLINSNLILHLVMYLYEAFNAVLIQLKPLSKPHPNDEIFSNFIGILNNEYKFLKRFYNQPIFYS